MRNFLLVFFIVLVVFALALGMLIFAPRPLPSGEGPRTTYRVLEGQIEIFGLAGERIRSFLGFLGPNEKLETRTISNASLKVPFWLGWLEPMLVEGLGRSRYLMYKLGEKTEDLQFTKTYTYDGVRKGFVKQVQKNPLIRNVNIDFNEKGFSAYGIVAGLFMSARGSAGVVGGGEDQAYLRLTWAKMGPFVLPTHTLRALEDLFARAYAQTRKYSIRMTKVTFYDKTMVLTFHKL